MKLSTVQKAFLAIIIANVIWGAASPIFKLSLQNIPPYTLAFWRFFVAAILLFGFLRKKAGLPATTSQNDIMLLMVYAISGITMNIIFFFLGLKLTYAINAPVIASSQPILTFFLALFFLRESFIAKKFIGMILGTMGIIIIVIEPLLGGGVGGSILGNVYLVIATMAAVIQTIVGKKILDHQEPIAITFWSFIIGAASFLPLAAMEYVKIPHLYQSLDWRGFTGLVFGAVFSSAIGYASFGWGLSKISATDAAMFSYIDPIVGTVLAAVLLHEPITGPFMLGSLLIFGGILIAEGRLNYHPIRKLLRYAPQTLEHITEPLTQEVSAPSAKNRKEMLKKIFMR